MNLDLPINAVLFDMDGLLLDTERMSFRCWASAAEEFGYQMPLSLFSRMIGRPVAENEKMVCDELGAEFPYWEARARRVKIMDDLLELEGVPVKTGARSLVQALDLARVPIAVVTSTEEQVAKKKLADSGLLSHFQFILGPEGVSNGKPAPDCYLEAAKRIAQAPERCLVFEDSPAGVRSASAAGMQVCWIPDLVPVRDELKQLTVGVCEDLGEVLDSLKSVLGL